MVEDQLKIWLRRLEFDLDSTESGLLFTNRNYAPGTILFEEQLQLHQAEQLGVRAVFFRRFELQQTSTPQVYIFDASQPDFDDNVLADAHKKIWSSGIVPLYLVVDDTELKIFDARRPLLRSGKNYSAEPYQILKLSDMAIEHYKAAMFENGSFWEHSENANRFLHDESAANLLIQGLKHIRQDFIRQSGLPAEIAHRLLVLSILVKYLEEKQDENGQHVFPSNYFQQYEGASGLTEVIRKGKLPALFSDLGRHFNGKIFELSEAEEHHIEQIDLGLLADFLDADTEEGQYVIWRLYSFDYLPVELISRIYEEFLTTRKDAVYTPLHIAKLMVDQMLPLNSGETTPRIIDISCGSGIFLVSVFKRLVKLHQKHHFEHTGELIRFDSTRLKAILRESVYGIDIEPDAVQLSVFSLSLAICDYLSPAEIWTQLHFEDFRKNNILQGDFFEYINADKLGTFDYVIGNPPFEHKKKDFQSLTEQSNLEVPVPVPGNQIALLFLSQAMRLLKVQGKICLVLPSGPLLYNKSQPAILFRKHLFSRYSIDKLFDLTRLWNKGYVFEKSVSTAILFATNTEPNPEHEINHITVKRSKSLKERLFFEIDHYDRHRLPLEIAINNPIIWKVNLMGGGLLYFLVNRLSKLRTLKTYLTEKKRNQGWDFSEGYKIGNRSKLGSFLTGRNKVITESFTEAGIGEIELETETRFERPRRQQIYASPHLLIKKNLGKHNFIKAVDSNNYVFNASIVGIHAPEADKAKLVELDTFLSQHYKLLRLYLLSQSSRAGISRSPYTILREDLLELPYPEKASALRLSKQEKIILDDFEKYLDDDFNKGELAEINITAPDQQRLEQFGNLICDSLNPVYESENGQFFVYNARVSASHAILEICYGQNPTQGPADAEPVNLKQLLESSKPGIIFKRVIRLYQKDKVVFIKPPLLRYWIDTIALRDATEMMEDLINSGF